MVVISVARLAILAAVCVLVFPAAAEASREQAVPVIRKVFGRYADEAIRVARCESNFELGARNGQFRGLFQLGSWERATYARGRYSTYLDQTLAAWRYFVATGRGWSPWECQP